MNDLAERQTASLLEVAALCEKHGKSLVDLLLWQDKRLKELELQSDGWSRATKASSLDVQKLIVEVLDLKAEIKKAQTNPDYYTIHATARLIKQSV